MNLYPGQKVVCIDAAQRTGVPVDENGRPKIFDPVPALRLGAVYTVRELDTRIHKTPDLATLRLEEIQGPIVHSPGRWEVGFAPNRFRPVTESKIDTLKTMLNPHYVPADGDDDAEQR